MSYEVLRQLSEHLRQSENEKHRLGGRAILELAGTLIREGYLPADDGTRLMLPNENLIVENPVLEANDFSYNFVTGEIFKEGCRTDKLTFSENAIFNVLVENSGLVIPKRAISRLLQYDVSTSYNDLLKTHISRIRSKLPVEKRRSFEIVETVREVGYRYNHFEKDQDLQAQSPPVENFSSHNT